MRLSLAIASLLCLAACVHRAQPSRSLLFPSEFTIKQHLLWNVRGKDYDFICLARKSQNELLVSAFNDLGGTVFEFSISTNGSVEIRHKPENMPGYIITHGIAADLQHLYSLPFTNTREIKIGDSTYYILLRSNDSSLPRRILISNRKFRYILTIDFLDS